MSSRTRLDERSLAWAKSLATAIQRWLRENGYKSGFALADELKIRRTTWSHIQAGNAVSQPEAYAAIFWRTKLPEADPCSLPPRLLATPKHASVRKERAWTPEQWQTWVRKHGHATPPSTSAVSALGGYGQAGDTGEVTFTAFFAELRAGRIAVENLTALLQPGQTVPDEIETLALRLKALLDRAVIGTPADRDRFQSAHGETVKLLLSLADALTLSDRVEREKAVARIREFGEVQL